MSPDDALIKDFETYKRSAQPTERSANVREISTADELFRIFQSAPFNDAKWVFRGQADASWELKPTIERYASKPGLAEDHVEREFKRRAHHFLQDLPAEDADLEWLALMQHHGAPTRLLDWTRSPYVAAFFAAESASPGVPFAIWVVDRESVNAHARTMLGISGEENGDLSSKENFRKVYREVQQDQLYLVVAVEPYRMNERLSIQQGCFLYANNPLIGFQRCFGRLLYYANKAGSATSQWLHKLVIAPEARLGALMALERMNINRATLFPGLDGFAQSLRTEIEILYPKQFAKASSPALGASVVDQSAQLR